MGLSPAGGMGGAGWRMRRRDVIPIRDPQVQHSVSVADRVEQKGAALESASHRFGG